MESFRIALFLAFFITYSYAKASPPMFRCDYTYNEELDAFLKYHDTPTTFYNARTRCSMEGSILASPINEPLLEAMKDIARDVKTYGLFTGIHSVLSHGDYFSVEGVPIRNIPRTWYDYEPYYKGEDNCVILQKYGTIALHHCYDTLPYVCYKKASDVNGPVTACGTTDPEYKLDPRTMSCYKFHSYPRTWTRAYMTCAAEGGYLAIINSKTEATVIRELYTKNADPKNVGTYYKGTAHIGFHDWEERGDWWTIHGQTLDKAGYNKFTPGEPNNRSTGQFCGGVFRSGLLDDMWCYRRALFICEKDPKALMCSDYDEILF